MKCAPAQLGNELAALLTADEHFILHRASTKQLLQQHCRQFLVFQLGRRNLRGKLQGM